ncbi:MAG: hypothetical protein NT013_04155 [Planctomycetia bacterium]|nr:hypothetical protein [Planctomycetia bacterium]
MLAISSNDEFAETIDVTSIAGNEKRSLPHADNERHEGWLIGLEPTTPRSTICGVRIANADCEESCDNDKIALHHRLHQNRSRKQKKSDDDRAEPKNSNSLPIKADSFSAALAMIASLPLSDAEKADAVRRLMAEQETVER